MLDSLVADLNNRSGLGNNVRRGLRVTARTAGAAKSIEAEVDKPLGLTLGQKPGGPVTITVSFSYYLSFPISNCNIYLYKFPFIRLYEHGAVSRTPK